MHAGANCRTGFVSRALLVAILLFQTAASSAQADAANIVELRTEIFGPGWLHVATNRTSIEIASGRYTIRADVKSRGIARLIADVTTHSEVSGTLESDELDPTAYRGEVHRNGVDIYNRVDYAVDGSATGASSLRAQSPQPLPPGPVQGTIDQLTAFYAMERKLAHSHSCQLDLTVFDGLHLYKLHFSDAGIAILEPSTGDWSSGPTQICRFQRQAIAGFNDDAGRDEGIFEGTLWCARLPDDQMAVPVHMELATEFGSLSGELAELRTFATDLHSPK